MIVCFIEYMHLGSLSIGVVYRLSLGSAVGRKLGLHLQI